MRESRCRRERAVDGFDGVMTLDRVRRLESSCDCRDGLSELFVDCLPMRVPMSRRDCKDVCDRDVFGVVSVPGDCVLFEGRA